MRYPYSFLKSHNSFAQGSGSELLITDYTTIEGGGKVQMLLSTGFLKQ